MTDRNAWADEGAYPVAPGVHRIPLPLPSDALRAVNVYAIETGAGLVLIDSGWALANAQDQLGRSLAAIGAGLGDVRRFLVTHMHRDHYTQAVQLRKLFGTPVALGVGEKPSIEGILSADFRPLRAQIAILRTAGAWPVADLLTAGRRGQRVPPGYDRPDEWLEPDQVIDVGARNLTVVPTPGHTRGHVVFTDPQAGLMFAGDHILPHITPSIGFQDNPAAQPLRQYLESLAVVRRLPDMRLLPAHGPVSASTHARIDELAEHHAQRLSIMADVLSGGEASAYEVAQAIGWTRRMRKLADLDPMNQMLAVCETVYHLDLLVAQSRAVSRTGDDGVRRYRQRHLDEEELSE